MILLNNHYFLWLQGCLFCKPRLSSCEGQNYNTNKMHNFIESIIIKIGHILRHNETLKIGMGAYGQNLLKLETLNSQILIDSLRNVAPLCLKKYLIAFPEAVVCRRPLIICRIHSYSFLLPPDKEQNQIPSSSRRKGKV